MGGPRKQFRNKGGTRHSYYNNLGRFGVNRQNMFPTILTENKVRPMVVSKTKCLKKTGKCIETRSQKMQKPGP